MKSGSPRQSMIGYDLKNFWIFGSIQQKSKGKGPENPQKPQDGLAGWCDRSMQLCLGLALWNGKEGNRQDLKGTCVVTFS